ncbi:MAG: hypothetical protein KJ956_14510 [Actinobacteria bacterium]|nr:hypothetical protein [Actinomycetota bacterium]
MLDEIRLLLKTRLDTRERVERAANAIGVSAATLYRYKSAPENIPLGKLSALNDLLGFSLGDGATWVRSEFIEAEERREALEASIAAGGMRLVVTPAFSVNAQLPDVTRAVMDFDHGVHRRSDFERYLAIRQQRRELYLSGDYESLEIIDAASYVDFFEGRGRYRSLSDDLRRKQIDELVRTTRLDHVVRRVYVRSTPELPIVSWYSTGTVVARLDDFVIEFTNRDAVDELATIVSRFYGSAEIQAVDQVEEFLLSPVTVLRSYGNGGLEHD